MSLFKSKIKIISAILFFIFIFNYAFLPKSVSALGYPVSDVLVETNTSYMSANMKLMVSYMSGYLPDKNSNPASPLNLKKLILKRILRQLTQSIVDWIDSGFQGNPAFITNTGQFIQDTADITIGDFLMNDPALSFLCDPFKIQIKLAMGLQYRPFKEQIACSFTSALGNVNKAMNDFTNGDFIGGGGWDSWMRMTTQPQNNQMGAMMLAQGELDARIEGNKAKAVLEANWGGGFMSWKDCPDHITTVNNTTITNAIASENRIDRYSEVTGQKRGDDGCVIKTPGGVIANKINWADTSTIRELEIADDINAIINALANQLITMGMQSLSGSGLLGSGKPKPNQAYNDYMTYLRGQETILTAQNAQAGGAAAKPDYYNTDGSINFGQTFANRAIALETIDSAIKTESDYATAQNNIFRLLTAAQNSFVFSNCADVVKSEIINQITGDYTGVKDLTWNKKDVVNASNITMTNISSLNTVRSSVLSVRNDSEVPGVVQSLTNLRTLHSPASVISYSNDGNTFNQIRNWISARINANKASCNINITDLTEWGIQ